MRAFKITTFALILVLAMSLAFVAGLRVNTSLLHQATDPARSLNTLIPILDEAHSAPQLESTMEPLSTFWEVLVRLKTSYVDRLDDDRSLAYGAIQGMLKTLNDPYTRFMDPDSYSSFRTESQGSFEGIGAVLGVSTKDKPEEAEPIIVKPFEGGPAFKAGLKVEDVIVAVDGKPTKGVVLDEVVRWIRGPRGTEITLTIRRKDVEKAFDVPIKRDRVELPTLESEIKDGIGIIRLYAFNENSLMLLDKALTDLQTKKVKGLVLDLRDNPGGLLDVAVGVASRFVANGPVVYVEERGNQETVLKVTPPAVHEYSLPMVVLVNKGSASASEIVSGALQDVDRAALVGETTFGKGLVQTVVPLRDGSAVAITTARYLTPSKRDINHKGIVPDYQVALSEEELKAGQDPQEAKALELVEQARTTPLQAKSSRSGKV